jgi:hypothetical protein
MDQRSKEEARLQLQADSLAISRQQYEEWLQQKLVQLGDISAGVCTPAPTTPTCAMCGTALLSSGRLVVDCLDCHPF